MFLNRSLSRAVRTSVFQQTCRRLNTTSSLHAAPGADGSNNGAEIQSQPSLSATSAEVSPPVKKPRGRPKSVVPKPPKELKTPRKSKKSKEPIVSEGLTPPEEQKIPTELKPKRTRATGVRSRSKKVLDTPVDPADDVVESFDTDKGRKCYLKQRYRLKAGDKTKTRPADKTRVNVLSESLCDDAIARLKPSLEKYIGCDIIDMNPGPCLFSSKLHEVLKPRSHILMEPDSTLYKPFLDPLLEAEGSTYKHLPKSGMHWETFDQVLSEEYLPHQEKLPLGDPRLQQPNNTLLFVANIGHWPSRSFAGNTNFPRLFLHQIMQLIQSQGKFHSYGLVRMLIWVTDSEKYVVLPRTISMRKALGVDAELTCGKLQEIAGSDAANAVAMREYKMEIQSSLNVVKKMESTGIESPVKRRPSLETDARNFQGELPMHTKRKFYAELKELHRQFDAGEFTQFTDPSITYGAAFHTAKYDRMKALDYRAVKLDRLGKTLEELLDEHESIAEAKEDVEQIESPKEKRTAQLDLANRIREFNLKLESRPESSQTYFQLDRDNRKAINQDNPILHWDRRDFEPLTVQPDEFYPEHPLTLLDFQPKPTWPLHRTKDNDDFQYIVSSLFMFPTQSVKRGLTALAPGAYDWIAPECPSLYDLRKGGCRDLDELPVRCLTEQHLKEIAESWIKWPFRPSRHQLLVNTGLVNTIDDSGEDDWNGLGI